MAKIEPNYIEKDELLYPNIKTGREELNCTLDKYEEICLHYVHAHKSQIYPELLFSCKTAGCSAGIDKATFDHTEQIPADYLEKRPMPSEGSMERIRLSAQAQMASDEIVTTELIFI